MKNTVKFLGTLLFAGLVLIFSACQTDSGDSTNYEDPQSVPLANVTNLNAKAKYESVLLTWTDATPLNCDIYGYEVSWETSESSSSAEILSENKIIVGNGVGGVLIQNLTNGTEYTFTVKTIDTYQSKSSGISVTATPAEIPPLKISLSVPAAKSNTSVTVTANITTDAKVKKVVYKKNGSINPAKLLADSTALSATEDSSNNKAWTFTISATDESTNGSYTVAAIDSQGHEEVEEITISNFDFTGPAAATKINGFYFKDSTITLNWKNPADSDFDHVEICYSTTATATESTSEASAKSAGVNVATDSKIFDSIEKNKEYTFYFVSVDKLGNRGAESSYTVTFAKIPAVSIKGDESWSPSSGVFISDRKLEIADFYMCDHEVTRDEFLSVMGHDPSNASSTGKFGNTPVNFLTWYLAIAYCNKLSIKEGLTPCYSLSSVTDWANLSYSEIPAVNYPEWNSVTCDFTANGYRLPTQVEWEWAARGGKISDGTSYSGSNNIDEVAWYDGNSDNNMHEVKRKVANDFGLYDLTGNANEWCWDWRMFTITSNICATGPETSELGTRVFCGGSCYDGTDSCNFDQSYEAQGEEPGNYHSHLGFRVVRSSNQSN